MIKFYLISHPSNILIIFFFSMNMVKSHLLGRNTLSSTIIGVIPREPVDDSQVRLEELILNCMMQL